MTAQGNETALCDWQEEEASAHVRPERVNTWQIYDDDYDDDYVFCFRNDVFSKLTYLAVLI
jgi:hypothetical protein